MSQYRYEYVGGIRTYALECDSCGLLWLGCTVKPAGPGFICQDCERISTTFSTSTGAKGAMPMTIPIESGRHRRTAEAA